MKNFSKNYLAWKKKFHIQKDYSLEEAVALLKKTKIEKFDSTINLGFHLNLNTKKQEHLLKLLTTLPFPLIKKYKICVFTQNFSEEAKTKNPFLVGGKELIEKINIQEKINFDLVLATPEIMPELKKIGKLLGTKKLMPSLKNGTLAKDIVALIESWEKGQKFYQVDSYGNFNFVIGKFSSSDSHLLDNFRFCFNKILKIKPAGIKGKYIKKIVLSTTMGPGLLIKNA